MICFTADRTQPFLTALSSFSSANTVSSSSWFPGQQEFFSRGKEDGKLLLTEKVCGAFRLGCTHPLHHFTRPRARPLPSFIPIQKRAPANDLVLGPSE